MVKDFELPVVTRKREKLHNAHYKLNGSYILYNIKFIIIFQIPTLKVLNI